MKIFKNEKNVIIIVLFVALLAIAIVPLFFKDEKLYGLWYRYNGTNIEKDIKNHDVSANVIRNDCTIFATDFTTDFTPVSKYNNEADINDVHISVGAYSKIYNRLFMGDAKYTYEIKKIDAYFVLYLYSYDSSVQNSIYVSSLNVFPEK